jgi:xanthine dehydrogenase molybdopterin-binding subunit B
MSEHDNLVGTSPLRKEGRAKVLGHAKYVDDLRLSGMWHGATVRSAIARGRIRAVHFAPEIDWSEFAIVRASDIPGENTPGGASGQSSGRADFAACASREGSAVGWRCGRAD